MSYIDTTRKKIDLSDLWTMRHERKDIIRVLTQLYIQKCNGSEPGT